MSTPERSPDGRVSQEFLLRALRRRELKSRIFSVVALGATLFGLAMLLVFLGQLGTDVYWWFQTMPPLVEQQNERLRVERQRLEEAEKIRDARRAEIERQMAESLAALPSEEEKAEERKLWETEIIPGELANLDKTIAERRQAASGEMRDSSPAALLGSYLTSGPAPLQDPQNAGVKTALLGSLYLVLITVLVAVPLGVGAAIYLEEYRADTWLARVIQININNLAGVPSIMFGILGAFLFVELFFKPVELEVVRARELQQVRQRMEQLPASATAGLDERGRAAVLLGQERALTQKEARAAELEAQLRRLTDAGAPGARIKEVREDLEQARSQLEDTRQGIERDLDSLYTVPYFPIRWAAWAFTTLGLSVASRNVFGGGLTLALLTLPVVIVASQEAIRAVPQSLRHGSLALGATRWQTIWKVVLPSSLPGILTGTILSMCRALGEAAPLVLFGALLYVDQVPHLFSRFTVMPMQIYGWTQRPQDAWRYNAALASMVLVLGLLLLNGVAIYLRQRSQRQVRY